MTLTVTMKRDVFHFGVLLAEGTSQTLPDDIARQFVYEGRAGLVSTDPLTPVPPLSVAETVAMRALVSGAWNLPPTSATVFAALVAASRLTANALYNVDGQLYEATSPSTYTPGGGGDGASARIPVTRSRALTSADHNALLLVDSPSPVYLTNGGNLPADFACQTLQIGAGTPIVVGVPGVTSITPPGGSIIARTVSQAAVVGAGISANAVGAILAAAGARVLLPGVGEMNFGQPLNGAYSDAAGLSQAALNGDVQSLRDSTVNSALYGPAAGAVFAAGQQTLQRNVTTGADFLSFGTSNAAAYASASTIPYTNRINPITIIVVAALSSSAGRTIHSLRWGAVSASDRFSLDLNGANIRARGNGWSLNTTEPLSTTPRVMTMRQASASARNLRVDGTERATDATVISSVAFAAPLLEVIGSESTTALAIAASSEWRGPFYARIVAPAYISDADVLVLERFFGSLAGATVA